MTDADTTLSALGELLEQHRGSLSKREAARRAGISEGRWRQIVTGQQKAGGGIVVPANPRRATVIAMAEAVDADVNEALTRAGMAPVKKQVKSSPEATESYLPSPVATEDAASVGTRETVEAIQRDPRLMDTAREHLLRQYTLLAQLSDLVDSSDEAAQSSPGPVTRPLRAVARKRPQQPDDR